jgi:hypothetical protein
MFAPGITTDIIAPFLGYQELLEYSCSNRHFHQELDSIVKKRKKQEVDQLIQYFILKDRKYISIHTRYDAPYKTNVRKLFKMMPELFQYIEENHITSLDLGCVTSYGGYPESPFQFVAPLLDAVVATSYQILDLLSHNTTLTYCNLGLFRDIMQRNDIVCAAEKHPVLDIISMLPNGATLHMNRLPNSLWRHRDGSFYWDHFRHEPN